MGMETAIGMTWGSCGVFPMFLALLSPFHMEKGQQGEVPSTEAVGDADPRYL